MTTNHALGLEESQNPPATYTTLEMEAALCIWEEMLNANQQHHRLVVSELKDAPAWMVQMMDMWEDHGTVAMRFTAAYIAEFANRVWDAIPEQDRDVIVYDWEFIPAIVARVPWEHGAYTKHLDAAHIGAAIMAEHNARSDTLRGGTT